MRAAIIALVDAIAGMILPAIAVKISIAKHYIERKQHAVKSL